MAASHVTFGRLTEVPLDDVVALLNEPRLRRHMPLSTDVTREGAADWVRVKDAQWETNGYGPWAVLVDETFAGWGGFQAEADGPDLALVLLPHFWGHGPAVARAALEQGFTELGLPEVLVALPPSRGPVRALARFGFTPEGEVELDGETFQRFRLTREAWLGLLRG